MRVCVWPVVGLLVATTLAASPAHATRGTAFEEGVHGTLGVVATESVEASRVGRDVLEDGGNAVDAAVATIFALGVARPQSCGIGGGGFLVYRSSAGQTAALDFRETAPAAIRRDQFVDDPLAKRFTGHTTVGVPGTVAGMAAALQRYGSMPLRDLVAPAERLARRGFRIPASLATATQENQARLRLFAASARRYLRHGRPLLPRQVLRQPELGVTLRRIMRSGPNAFYRGTIARQIVDDMRARRRTNDPGLMTRADLAAYRARWRDPLVGQYRGRDVIAMPPPTSGGVAILQMLNLLEGFDLREAGYPSTRAIHLIAEAQRIAWADRGAYLADPDFRAVPTRTLISEAYADQRRGEIDPTATKRHGPGPLPPEENPQGSTTHVSIIDAAGNAVAVTCTIEQEFGSAVVVPGAGFLLNNELTDFGAPGSANEPAPGKRPRSSMSPTIVAEDGRPLMVAGGAGGSTIIMGVLESILNRVDFTMSLSAAVDAERFDSQGTGTLLIEDRRVPTGVLSELEFRGWRLSRQGEYALRPRVQLAGEDAAGVRTAVSDSRSDFAALAQRTAG